MSYGWSHSGTALTPAQRHAALARDRHTCRTCGDTATEVDHIINLAQGGTHDPVNLQALCTPCHRAKTETEALTARKAAWAARDHLTPAPKRLYYKRWKSTVIFKTQKLFSKGRGGSPSQPKDPLTAYVLGLSLTVGFSVEWCSSFLSCWN